jgi:hypothetical protein
MSKLSGQIGPAHFASTRVRRTFFRFLAVSVICAGLAACYDEATVEIVPGDQASSRIAITNTQQLLDMDVSHPNAPVPVDSDSAGIGGLATKVYNPNTLKLTLVSEIAPPIVDGERVQATSVVADVFGWSALVSYNMRGAPHLGAIDLVSRLFGTELRLTSRAVFNDADVNAVTSHGLYVYAAEANVDAGFSTPSVLERLRIRLDKFTLEDNRQAPLSSFAATSVMRTNKAIYATSGDAGHVFAFDSSMDLVGQFPLHDARWVAWDSKGKRVVVAQGTPGQISVFEEDEFPAGSMALINVFPFPGANVPESKSTVEIAGGKAFIAAGPDGVQVVCLDNGQIVGAVPRPDPDALGLDPSVVVTNAVTINNDLMFISNGEAGVYVAQGDEDFDKSPCGSQQNISLLGKLRFDDLESVNHIDYKGDHLFVAAGLGGVKVVHVNTR